MQIKLNKFQEFTMSYWLKARIAEIPSRDVLDMYNDTLWLAELLKNLMDQQDEHSTECNCWTCETKEPFGLDDFQKSGPYA